MICRRAGAGRRTALPCCSLVNPRAHEADLFGGQRVFLLRHAGEVGVHPREHLDDEALGAFSGNDRRTVIPAFERKRSSVQPQARLLFLLPVTIVTALGKQ
jgi:hypothetical protein